MVAGSLLLRRTGGRGGIRVVFLDADAPREPFFQGLITAASAAIGYAVGFAGSRLVRNLDRREASPRVKTVVKRVVLAICIVGTVAMLVWFWSGTGSRICARSRAPNRSRGRGIRR